MADNRARLEQDLTTAVSRLRRGRAVAVAELPGASGDNCPFADEVEGIQVNESREIAFATRELLLERVKRLSAAIERMSQGDDGSCVECGDPISPARVKAMPEVQTCVCCQEALDRLGRHADRSRPGASVVGHNGPTSGEPGFSWLGAPVRRRARRLTAPAQVPKQKGGGPRVPNGDPGHRRLE